MRLLTLLFSLGFFTLSFSQIYFSCNYREECQWNKEVKQFEECNKLEDLSMFVLNVDRTMFYHTSVSGKSAYYIQKNVKDDVKDVHTYEVYSDDGRKYLFVLVIAHSEFRIMPLGSDEVYMLRYYIKKSWTEEVTE